MRSRRRLRPASQTDNLPLPNPVVRGGPSGFRRKPESRGEGQGRRMPVQGPERTPFSDADAAIPAERAGVTYGTSEKERIEQRRAARLSVCRPESRRSGDVGGPGTLSTIHQQSHAPQRRGDASKRLTNPPPPVRERNTDPLSLWERVRVRAPGRTPLPPRGRPQPDA